MRFASTTWVIVGSLMFAACGDSFSAGGGTDSGSGTTDGGGSSDSTTAAEGGDSSTLGQDSAVESGAVEGSVPESSVPDAASIDGGPKTGGVPCGQALSCSGSSPLCCLGTSPTCGTACGCSTQLACASDKECSLPTAVCCIGNVKDSGCGQGHFVGACAAACLGDQSHLCDPNAASSGCLVGKTCSTDTGALANVGLPPGTLYGVCQ
jgi:hypothetical protein